MKKKVIRIDEGLCVGCGNCVTGCHQGALKVIDGKARLVKEDFCDGLGMCIGTCPTGALSIEEKQCSCPGSMIIDKNDKKEVVKPTDLSNVSGQAILSDLRQWPVQLHLVSPQAPYFKDAELAVISTCSPLASADMHWKFIRGRAVVVACPKLDDTSNYAQKLADIFKVAKTPKVLSIIMSVPCCKGLTSIVNEAVSLSGRKDIKVEEHVININ